jgi:hypothetical protein
MRAQVLRFQAYSTERVLYSPLEEVCNHLL